jgi:hypothetical protein
MALSDGGSEMPYVSAAALAVLLVFAGTLTKPAHAAVAVTGLGMTGMEIHLKTDTTNLPPGDVIDPL